MWSLVFLGCANNITALYEAEKAAVMAAPAALGKSWDPEVRMRFSDKALQSLAETAVEGGLLKAEDTIEFKGPMGVNAELSPTVEVKGVQIGASKACDACLDLSIDMDGNGRWKISRVGGEIPISLTVSAVLGFDVAQQDGVYTVSGRLKDVKSVKVKSESVGDVDVAKLLKGWTEDLAARVPPFTVASFGGEDLPLRAFRLATSNGALAIEGVTNVAGGGPLAAPSHALDDGWELAISETTALALMRRAAFEAGVLSYDVAADPRSLELNGSVFTLGVRLWRLTRSGWWRDYTVTGQVEVSPRAIKLVPKVAKEGEKSPGAGAADPLALLAEGAILGAVEDGLAQSLPTKQSTTLGDKKVTARATSVKGMGGALVVRGDVRVGEDDDDEEKAGSGEGRTRGGRKQRRERAEP